MVEALIEELTAERLLDDQRYVTQFVRIHADRGHGPRRIRQELSEAGLPGELIAAALETGPDFHAIARQVRARRFGPEVPQDWQERARQGRFLQYRGFSPDHIASALGGSGVDDDFPHDEGP